jgi:serine/threonine protein kinase
MMTGLDMPDPGWLLGGRYTLLDPLGEGIAGEVWRGRDEAAATECAVKLLRPELVQDEGALARMRATVAWISQLTHPNIVPVDDIVEQDESVALISRLVPGENLRALLDRQGTMPIGAALSLTAQLCDALSAARHVGVAHGDVKPSNLLLESDLETEIALRVTDFGMAALLGRAVVQQTVTSQAADANVGAEYVAPELGAGEAPTEAADVYAAGVVLYEALTGEPPFGRRPQGHARRDASAVVSLPAEVPDSVADALTACLDENPRHRPSAADFAAVLRQASGQVVDVLETVPPSPAVEVTAGPDLGFFGDGAHISGHDSLPARLEQPETAVTRRAGSVVAARGAGHYAQRTRGGRLWTIIAAALCGVALAAFITYGLTTHGSPRADASTLPTRVGIGAPVGSPISPGSAIGTPTNTLAPTASVTASNTASATPSASPARPSASPVVSASASAAPSPSSSAPQVSHTGRLYNQGSGTCLDTSGGYYANGVAEQIWTCNNGANQVFTLATTGQLTIDGGQYCLDDASSADATGTHPELFTCGSQSHQRWTMRSDGSIVGDHSGLCLNAPGNDDGTQLDFEPCSGQSHQLWSWD